MSIRLSRMSPNSNKTWKDFELLKLSYRLSHQLQSVSHGGTEGDLYLTVFHLYRARIELSISRLRVLFRENREQLDQMISNIFGVFDDHPHPFDGSLKDNLMAFHCLISRMDSQFRVQPRNESDDYDEMNAIVETAYKIYSLQDNGVQKRLQVLAGDTLAEPLHNHIQTLARPRQCHNAFVSYARACRGFNTMNLGYGMPPTPRNAKKAAASATSQSVPARSAENGMIIPSSNQNQSSSAVLMDISTLARTYLSATDSHLSPHVLQPASKRHAFSLMAFVLNDLVPKPKSDIYYLFGFVACESETAVNLLGRVYKKLLTTSRDKAYTSQELWQSLENHCLTQVFDRNGLSNFRTESPLLEQFFNLPLEDRPSVYRLIQFLRVNEGDHDDSDPVACGGLVLIRDYGFHLCKGREEVEILKETYRRALQEINALDLHAACIGMHLSKTVLATNVALGVKHQRLLQNQGPLPDLGFEKIISDFRCRQGLFKKDKKRDRAARRIW